MKAKKMIRIIPRPRYRLYLDLRILLIMIKKIISGKVYKGGNICKFEEKFRKYIGTKYGVSAPMARTSLYVILKSLNLKEGGEVLTTTYTVPCIANMILCANLKPVFVDIDDTYNIDPKKIEEKITGNTKAIVLTHLFGQPCDMDSILAIAKKHNIITIEDCAQACGAEYKGNKVGSLCDFGYFSFGSYKNVTTFWGGIITTNNKKASENIRKELEKYPQPSVGKLSKKIMRDIMLWFMTSELMFPFTYIIIAIINLFDDRLIDRMLSTKEALITTIPQDYKFRYTNLQASIGLYQLERLERVNQKRILNAEFYNANIKSCIIPKKLKDVKHTYLNYPVRHKNRNKVIKKLFKSGIDATAGNIPNCVELDIFKEYYSDCPIANKLVKEIFYLPIQPQLKKKHLEYIVKCLEK